ncbi:RDD family protein [Methanobrevibacter sp.]|uniref:RDD family protein n=1 Tax=Methanobrevibacter sp. TaxID=66852 RepID=UPI00389009FC
MVSVFSRRVIAYIIDFFVVSAFMWIVTYLVSLVIAPANSYSVYSLFVYLVPILIYIYFVISELFFGASVGKSVMYLQVRSRNGARISAPQAIVRNLTKIYWVPIIFDWAIGKILKSDRLLNKITQTVVVDEL